MKTKLIITEKKTITDKIVKAIAPELNESKNKNQSHRDILVINPKTHNIESCYVAKNNLKENNYHYFCQRDCRNCTFEAVHVDGKNQKKASNVKKNLETLIETQEKEHSEKPTNAKLSINKLRSKKEINYEDISYYVIEKEDTRYIIADTSGNCYSLKNINKTHMRRTIFESKNFEELEKKLILNPSYENISGKRKRSYFARSFFLNSILANEKLPCDTNTAKKGSRISIDEIIGATDFDIAGSNIFNSVIEAANNHRKNRNQDVMSSRIRRINPDDLSEEPLRQMIESPREMDWENVYSGMIKEYFDFIYGITLTNQFNYFKRKINPESKLRFSIGRTMFLGLKEVLKEEKRILGEQKQNYTYLIFDGLLDLDLIKDKLAQGDYISFQTQETHTAMSKSRFLETCEQNNIGTHTTRYNLIKRLEKTGVISTDDRTISSTPFGKVYFSKMKDLLDDPNNPFNITRWSNIIQRTIDLWRSDNDISSFSNLRKDEMENHFKNIMNSYFESFKNYLNNLDYNTMNNTISDLINAFDTLPKPTSKRKPRKPKYEDSNPENQYENELRGDVIELNGLDSCISQENVRLIIGEDNLPLSNALTKIRRKINRTTDNMGLDQETIRRICNISSDYQFTIQANPYNIHEIQNIRDGYQTVFRFNGNLELNGPVEIGSYTEMVLDKNEVEIGETSSAHEPLFVDDARSGMAKGKEGFVLMKEYNLPWQWTYDKRKKASEGLINVESLNIKGHSFNRHDRYEYGKVHNFESLLSAMQEKYGFSFDDTAKMAENLYLNASD
ncbi:MAG: hypothetical protein ACLFPQ_00550 [Candidatus Woesearchaeota archaeon]